MNSQTLSFISFLPLILCSWCVSAREGKGHVLVADWVRDRLEYKIDGHVPKGDEGLLLALSRARSADADPAAGIVVLVHERAELADVANLIGLIIKADYSSYEMFVFDKDKSRMKEMRFSTSVPFSEDAKFLGK